MVKTPPRIVGLPRITSVDFQQDVREEMGAGYAVVDVSGIVGVGDPSPPLRLATLP
jgi:hypothetical protein